MHIHTKHQIQARVGLLCLGLLIPVCCGLVARTVVIDLGQLNADEPGQSSTPSLRRNSLEKRQVVSKDSLLRTWLSSEEVTKGFQIFQQPDGKSVMIVHPDSQCWLELPITVSAVDQPDDAGIAPGFVGPLVCMACHKEHYASFANTSHFKASQAAGSASILGPFDEGSNRLETKFPDMTFSMTRAPDGTFEQNVHFRSLTRSKRFDIVTGSGHIAQTYLYWEGNGLYQLHVSYYTRQQRWINSPGFGDGTAWYARRTIAKCAECHMTYMAPLEDAGHLYRRAETIFGVTCERCHGPGKEHVAFHRQHPGYRQAQHITNPARLSRSAANDVCAQCHMGSAEPLQPSFTFRPGDRAEDFWKLAPESDSLQGSVHSSNQLLRLQMSKCFSESQMTCTDCHHPHRHERSDLELFSQRCASCHTLGTCHTAVELGEPALNNCIDCHMDMGYDDHIQMETTESIQMPLLRDHHIRILPKATERFKAQHKP